LREKNGLKGRLISCAKVDAAVELSWITNSFIQYKQGVVDNNQAGQ
jgi:hypothetical protein